jgi:hypothetical protein
VTLNKATRTPPCVLSIDAGRLRIRRPHDEEAVPAAIVYLRPLSARSEIAFFDEDSQELLSLNSLDELAPSCRKLAEAALAERYHLPQITRVNSIETIFGTHYWSVDTDKGSCAFAFKEPGKNVTYLSPEHIVLRDAFGNRYEIRCIAELDGHSRRQVHKIF